MFTDDEKKKFKLKRFLQRGFGAIIAILIGLLLTALFTDKAQSVIQPVAPTVTSELIVSVQTPIPTKKAEPRYGFTNAEIKLLAQLLCGDANKDGDGEYDLDFRKYVNYNEVSKVLDVVMNRVRSNRFPNTVVDVVLADGQFVVFPKNLNTQPSALAIKVVGDWCRAYDSFDPGVQVIPESHLFFTGDGITNTTY